MSEIHIILTRAVTYRDKHYKVGDTLEVSENTAQWLIEVGAANTTPTEKPTTRKPKADS